MISTVAPTPPKSPQGFTLVEVDGDDARVGRLRDQPEVARPGLDAMAGSDLGEIPPSLGKRVSRDLVRFLIVFSIGVGTSLVWQWYRNANGAMWPQLISLALESASVLQAAPAQTAATQATASPELQQLKKDLAQLKQEVEQLKGTSAALASLRQSVDRLAGSQQQIAGSQQQTAGTVAKLSTQKPAAPPRPAPAPAPKPLTPPQSEVR
jgi:hypothetical protein